MHRILVFVACLLATIAANNASAVDVLQDRKYCGSGFTEKLVPEAPFGCDMSEACKAHDACYSKCDPGGELHGKPYCLKSEFSIVRLRAKAACERQFYANIDRINNGKWACKGLGAVYVAAVAVAGQGPFNGRPMQHAGMEDLILTSNGIDELKTKTSTMASLSQRGLVNLQKPRRVQDKLVFDQLTKENEVFGPTIDFSKGALQKDLQKIQSLNLKQ